MFFKFHKIFDAFSGLERKIFEGATLVFIFSTLLNGANLFYKKTILSPAEGGSFTEGLVGQPISINPLIAASNDVDRDLIELMFSDLWELTQDIKTSEDNKVWTVELLENLVWSDGEPLSADDVVFTLETIQNPETRSPLFITWDGVVAEKLNNLELRLILKSPYAYLSDNLKSLKIVPKHIWSAIPSQNLRLSDYNLEPIGSGPYVFAGYEKRKDGFISQYRLKSNENFYASAPLIQDLRVRFFQNMEEAITAFNKKEVSGLGGLSNAELSAIQIGYQLHEINIPRYYSIFFNPSTSPALKNKEVREALNLATDREKIINQALDGKAVLVSGPIYPGLEGYNHNVTAYDKFSLEAAAELLEVSNWKLNENGIRTKTVNKQELTLEFEIIVPQIDFLEKAVNIIAADWKTIGVNIKPIILSPNAIVGEIIKTRSYQMILFGNILKNNPDIFSFWHSSERFHPGLNLALYENKTVDGLLEAIRRNFDANSRVRDIKKLQTLILQDLPALFLFSPNYLYAAPKDLGGFTDNLIASPANRFDTINKWYLKTARVFK